MEEVKNNPQEEKKVEGGDIKGSIADPDETAFELKVSRTINKIDEEVRDRFKALKNIHVSS